MMEIIDETGSIYGRLTVLTLSGTRKAGRVCWACKCACGNTCIVSGKLLRNGDTTSCGCAHRDAAIVNGHMNLIDRTGRIYGRLTVKTLSPARRKNGSAAWLCECSCGKTVTVSGRDLHNGNTKSCGCLCKEVNARNRLTHGMSQSPEHRAWSSMIQRCTNSNNQNYPNYGGRGIKIAEEWLGPEGFARWFAHIGPRPSKDLSHDRKDPNGNYEPGNVWWATKSHQATNRRDARAIESFSDAILLKEVRRRGLLKAFDSN